MVTATSSLTAAAAPPLTTVFTQLGECASLFTPVNTTRNGLLQDGLFTTWAYFLSDTAAPEFPSCQPSGWDSLDFTFSPAVCPRGWIYYTVSETSTLVGQNEDLYSQGFCCVSGFSHVRGRGPPFPTQGCESTTTSTATTSATTIRLITGPDVKISIFAHQAIVAQWHKSETKDLPYSLPKVPKPTLVHEWTPGTEVRNVDGGAGSSHGGGIATGAIIAGAVVGTIVCFILFIVILWCMKRSIEGRPPTDAPAQQGTELTENREKRAK